MDHRYPVRRSSIGRAQAWTVASQMPQTFGCRGFQRGSGTEEQLELWHSGARCGVGAGWAPSGLPWAFGTSRKTNPCRTSTPGSAVRRRGRHCHQRLRWVVGSGGVTVFRASAGRSWSARWCGWPRHHARARSAGSRCASGNRPDWFPSRPADGCTGCAPVRSRPSR